MVGLIPDKANEIVELELDKRLSSLMDHFTSNAFMLCGPLLVGVDGLIRDFVENATLSSKKDRLVVVLDTQGGYIEVVQRIVETLRYHYDYVDFIIPNSAYSAGTVLAMSGDAIYMNYYSRLGPIDPQVMGKSGEMAPALGYLIAWDRLLAKAKRGELTDVEAELMIGGFDQAELYKYEQARELSIALLKEWLVSYKFNDWKLTETRKQRVTPRMKNQRAAAIAKELNNTERWHSHGHGISMEVLRRYLRLKIDDYDDHQANPGLGKLVKDYYTLFEDYRMRRGGTVVLHYPGHYLLVA